MRRRILVTIIAVAALAVVAFFVPAAVAIRSRIQRGDLLELQREASMVASRIEATGPVDPVDLAAGIDPGHELGFYDRTGNLVSGEGPAVADELVTSALAGLFAEGHNDGDLVVAVPLRPRAGGPDLVIRIREPSGQSQSRIARNIGLLGLAGIGVIATAALVGLLLARRLSRPVEELKEWAVEVGREGRPPPVAGVAELDELAGAMSESNDHVRRLLQRERSFSSHVAHQLRTPIAAMRVAVETELDSPRPDSTDVLGECLGELDRLEKTVTSLLELARHDEREPAWCDVTAVVRAQAERWQATFAAAGRDVRTVGAPVWATVDAAALTHIVDVLLENALVHGRGTVTATTIASPTAVQVDVGDEGQPPVAADPFSDRRADSGHGIGLRLARTLVESQGGQLVLVEAPATVFRLMLPAGD